MKEKITINTEINIPGFELMQSEGIPKTNWCIDESEAMNND